MTDTEIRLRLAEEDEEDLKNGSAETVHEAVSASMLIWQGLELEEQQFVHARIFCAYSQY